MRVYFLLSTHKGIGWANYTTNKLYNKQTSNIRIYVVKVKRVQALDIAFKYTYISKNKIIKKDNKV